MGLRTTVLVAAAVILAPAASATPLVLYLDPGTGSAILQAIVAGFLGLLLWIKLKWQIVKRACAGFFRRGGP